MLTIYNNFNTHNDTLVGTILVLIPFLQVRKLRQVNNAPGTTKFVSESY